MARTRLSATFARFTTFWRAVKRSVTRERPSGAEFPAIHLCNLHESLSRTLQPKAMSSLACVNPNNSAAGKPLCVALDGTLIRPDLIYECLLTLARQNVLYVFFVPFWLFAGKASFKRRLAESIAFDAQ